MKNLIKFSTVLLIVYSFSATAQLYHPTEQRVPMGKVTATAWVVEVNEEPLDALKKSWAAYVKQELDVKVKKGGRDQLVVKKTLLPRIYAHVGDLKAKFFTKNQKSVLAVAFMPGYDLSLNTQDQPEEAETLRRLTKNFVKFYKTNQLNQLIAEQEKRERSIDGNYQRNKRETKKLNKHIAKLDKQLASDKTEANRKFDLQNQRVENESRIQALETVMLNQKQELNRINQRVQRYRADISQLEQLFTETLAEQQSTK